MEKRLEQTILKNLIQSEEFARKVIPFLKSEYFTEVDEKTVFAEVKDYFDKYTKNPTIRDFSLTLTTQPPLRIMLFKVQKG